MSDLDAVAFAELGARTENITDDELTLLRERRVELDGIRELDRLIVPQLLEAELEVRRLRTAESEVNMLSRQARTVAELKYLGAKFDVVQQRYQGAMQRYGDLAVRSGYRKFCQRRLAEKAKPASPLSDLWLRWREQQGTTDNPSETPRESEGDAE
jgi:hypothetical protein